MRFLFITALAVLTSAAAHAANFTALSSGATRSLLTQAATASAKKSGNQMTLTIAASPAAVRDRVRGGEVFDLAVANTEFIDELAKTGEIENGTQTCIGLTFLGLAVRAGAAKPDIDDEDKFKAAMLKATTVAYATEGTSGPHLLKVFKDLGIDKEMEPKLRPMTSPGAVLAVAEGRAEMAVLLTSSIVTGKGIELAAELPIEAQLVVSFDAAVTKAATAPKEAEKFLKFMLSPEAEPVLEANGMISCNL